MADAARPSRLARALHRGRWPLTSALVAALLAGSSTLVGLIDGMEWWLLLVGFGALLLLVPAVLRSLGVPRLLASLLDLVLFAACLLAYLGIPPTPEGLSRLGAFFHDALETIQRASVPATPLPELLGLVVGVGGLVAVLLDLAAVTVPALVGLVLLVVVVVPAFFLRHGVDLLALAACVLAYLLVLAVDGRIRLRVRGARTAAGIIGGATALALLVTFLTPGLQRTWWQGVWASGVAHGAASLLDLANSLQTASSTEVLRYETDLPSPPYLQLATLSDYNGTTWIHREGPQGPMQEDRWAGAPGLTPGVPATAYRTQIQIQNFSAEWAPAPYPAQTIQGGAGRWTYDMNDLSLTLTGPSLSYLNYVVESLAVAPGASDLASTSVGTDLSPDVLADLKLPGNLPQIITNTATSVTQGQTTMLGKAQALQHYLRSSGGFSYSLETPDDQSTDGMRVIASFLERKTGYCIHFASAMAVMARVLGIPSRIAIGYLPGARKVDPGTDQIYYSESNQRLHAWPQLYFPGIGWLDFEPTVGLGAPADYTQASSPATGPTSTPTDGATDDATPTRVPSARPTDTAGELAPTSGSDDAATTAGLVGWGIAVVVVLAALLLPNAIRRSRRRRRLRRLAGGGPSGIAWAEVWDTARDVGVVLDPAETPRAFATRLGHSWSVAARAELDALVLEVERAAFGPPGEGSREAAVIVAHTTTVIRETEAHGSRQGLSRVLPRSLLHSGG